MDTYYELLQLKPRASVRQVDIAFRRLVARYRPSTTVDHLLDDPQFVRYMNAYLTLTGPQRAAYDAALSRRRHSTRPRGARPTQADARPTQLPEPAPLAALPPLEQRMLMARIAGWRTEHVECIGYLRGLLAVEPHYAPAWAMLGEILLTIRHADDAVQALERAIQLEPNNAAYAGRLRHAREVQAETAEYIPELTPQELYTRATLRARRIVAAVVGLLALAIMLYAFLAPIVPRPDALNVPWRTVAELAVGAVVCFFALAYAGLLQPFERVMLWSSMAAGDRGRIRSYPYGLILLVTAVPSMWLATLVLLIIACMDEEWPVSASVMLGACALLNGVLTFLVSRLPDYHDHWSGVLLLGGNALVLAAMLGWWLGSLLADELW